MAGLLNPPNMGIYNVSKHAVVALSETLYQDLQLVTDQIGASVLCPYFVPTGITTSERNRPGALAADKPTQEPADRQGDERPRRRQRQGERGRGRPLRLRRHRREALLHLQPPEGAGQACRRASRTSCRRAIRPIRSPRKPEIGAELRAALRAAD